MRKHFTTNDYTAEMTPLFWSHGKYDEHILIEQQVLGCRKLMDRGVDVTQVTYPVGHESFGAVEIEEMADFVDDVLFPKVTFEELQEPSFQYQDVQEETETAEFLASLKYLFDQNEGRFRP